MPIRDRYWSIIPRNVIGGDSSYAVLRAWGITPWGSEFGKEGNFEGWQRIRLPSGWHTLLEEGNVLLCDDKDQIRASIKDLLRISLDSSYTRKGPRKRRQSFKPPSLELHNAIRIRQSFCLGDEGPYSMWAENAFEKEIYTIRDVNIHDAETKIKLPEMRQTIIAWLNDNYPDWEDPLAYWDTFV